jgi:hypothetical protein
MSRSERRTGCGVWLPRATCSRGTAGPARWVSAGADGTVWFVKTDGTAWRKNR